MGAKDTKAPIAYNQLTSTRADFNETLFINLITQKGLQLRHEKYVPCPCRNRTSGQPNVKCADCYGTGAIYTDTVIIRGVIQALSKNPRFNQNGEVDEGSARLTVLYDDRVAWMDRITMLDGEDVFTETIYPIIRTINIIPVPVAPPLTTTECSAITTYESVDVDLVLLFVDSTTQATELVLGTDYTVSGRKIILSNDLRDALALLGANAFYQLSVRYRHNPQYLVNFADHNIRNTRVIENGSKQVVKKFPVSVVIRKLHFMLGDRGLAEFAENNV